MVESVEINQAWKKICEGECLLERIVLSFNYDPKTKPASAPAVTSRRTKLRPQEARRMEKINKVLEGACDRK